MSTKDHVCVTWQEWAGIVVTCTATGATLGAASYWEWHEPRIPVGYLPALALGALVVSFAFALVASVFAAILVIVLSKYGARLTSKLALTLAGAIAGAAVGAVHPLVIVPAVVGWISAESFSPVALAVLVAASGFISGALIVPKYVPRVRARIVIA
jgi:uncharacterized membrane protein